jgi:hypothetical protein
MLSRPIRSRDAFIARGNNDWSSQQRANHVEIPSRAEVSCPCSPLFKWGRVYPSTTTARIGPKGFGIDGPDCTIPTPAIRLKAIGARGTAAIRIIIKLRPYHLLAVAFIFSGLGTATLPLEKVLSGLRHPPV